MNSILNYGIRAFVPQHLIRLGCRLLVAKSLFMPSAYAFALISLFIAPFVEAATYVNASTTFNWINASGHTKVGYNTVPYKFNGLAGCGTAPPVIDDTISDVIPLGFNFSYGGTVFDSIRIMTNGRIHFVSTTLPLDNTTCGFGSPVTQLPYPVASLAYTMRIYGNDMDPTLLANYGVHSTPCQNANTCYVSFASIGTAPSRQFVVTWNNVPEWAGTTSNPQPTGNYNLQIILNEAGDFIYQYGTDTPGPSAALGQVGWQISTTDYEIPAVGYPVPNTAVHFFIPHPVVEYLMEQPSWSGSGSVLDTSGNSMNGTPIGSAQTVVGGRVCRGVTISATGANAINSNLSVPTEIGNAGTIAFWYKANTAWSGAGTQDALLFDATTVPSQFFQLVRRSNGRLRLAVTDSTGTVRTVETAAITTAANTWRHIAVTWNFNNLAVTNNDRLRIFVDGTQMQQTAFTSTTTNLSSTIGSLYIGGTRNSLAAPSSTTNSADATLDEFRAYNYEATAATITLIMNLNTGGCLNHYSIANGGTGKNCLLSPFTFTAHTLVHGAFVNNAQVTLSTSDGTGTWSLLNGHGVVTNIGTNTGNATYLFNNESQAVIGLAHIATGTITAHVTDGTYSELPAENTALVISNCLPGKFNACEVSSTRCTPTPGSITYSNLYTKLADTAFALDIVALNNQLLDTSFHNRTVTVALLANTNPPISLNANNCPPTQTAVIPLGSVMMTSGRAPAGPPVGISVAANAFSNVNPNYSAYRDVRVRFSCTGQGCNSGPWCATDPFTVRPQSFTIDSSANADSTGGSVSATPAVKAGSGAASYYFTLTANAVTAGYNGAPNIDGAMAEWPGRPAGGRVIPSGAGTVSGSFTTAATLGTGNGATGSSFNYDEAGYFRFRAGGVYDVTYAAFDAANGDCISVAPNDFSNTLSGGKYGCKIANQAASLYFGRFIPDHFRITSPSLTQGCVTGDFTYMDQAFNLSASIEAQNSAGAKTQNYSGAFAKGVVSEQAENGNNGTSLGSRVTFTAPWTNGAAAFSATQFSRPTTTAPDATWGPYDNLAIGAVVTDSDGVLLINRDMDQTNTSCTADSSGTSNGTCPAATIRPSAPPLPATLVLKQRMGALKISNAYGSELLALPISLQAKYWNGSWVTNTLDSCTSFPASSIRMDGYAKSLAACETVLSPAGTLTLTTGVVSGLRLDKPGVNNDGSVNLTVNTNAASGNTCLSATQSAATNASLPWFTSNTGRATFGVYKGNKEFIYMREAY